MKINYNAIGQRIRELRRRKCWTQEKLAEKSKIAPDYLCRIELGKKHPSLETIVLIANALDTTVNDLLFDVQKTDISVTKKEEKFLLAGCTREQKRFLMVICRIIKEEMIKYDDAVDFARQKENE